MQKVARETAALSFFLQKRKKKIIFILSFFITSICYGDIAIILNSANKGISLSRTEVEAIFLKTQSHLSNGVTVVPYDQGQTEPIRQTFYKLISGKSVVEMKTYWSRINFTGQGVPPTVLPNGEAVIKKVSTDTHAIGYVNADLVKGSSAVSIALLLPTQ